MLGASFFLPPRIDSVTGVFDPAPYTVCYRARDVGKHSGVKVFTYNGQVSIMYEI